MEDLSAIVKSFFSNIWSLFSGVTIPGLNMTAAQLFIALFVVGFSFRLIAAITGFGTNVGSVAEGFRTSRERLNEYRTAMRKKNNGSSH